MSREYHKKEWIIRCGGAEAYLTAIEKGDRKKGEGPTYVYGTQDKKKALRFTEEEAWEICAQRKAEMIRVNYREKKGEETDD